ncbi:hypothetical protein FQN50_005327 [Emmonsiellopsis sp. PD_5]|nr:hypothetical protein FQN50_005327 [Emmonsiellopsis sp. PD_5]
MSKPLQEQLVNAKTRSREAYDERVAAVRDRPSLSQYFDKWIAIRRCDLDYFLCYRQGLIDRLAKGEFTRDDFNTEMDVMYRDHMNELEQLSVLTTRRAHPEDELYETWETRRDNRVENKDWTAISSVDEIFTPLMDRNTQRVILPAIPFAQPMPVFEARTESSDGNSPEPEPSPLAPRELQCKSLDFFLGQTGVHIWDGESGLLVPRWLARALDLGVMMIVPETDVDQHGHMLCKLHLVDEGYRAHRYAVWDVSAPVVKHSELLI